MLENKASFNIYDKEEDFPSAVYALNHLTTNIETIFIYLKICYDDLVGV